MLSIEAGGKVEKNECRSKGIANGSSGKRSPSNYRQLFCGGNLPEANWTTASPGPARCTARLRSISCAADCESRSIARSRCELAIGIIRCRSNSRQRLFGSRPPHPGQLQCPRLASLPDSSSTVKRGTQVHGAFSLTSTPDR